MVEAHLEFQKVYGDAAINTTCRDWFGRFKDGDFYIDDSPCEESEERPKTSKMLSSRYCLNETITRERYRIELMGLSRALRIKTTIIRGEA